MMGAMVSPLRGADGNVEFLALVQPRPGGRGVTGVDLDAVVAGVDAER